MKEIFVKMANIDKDKLLHSFYGLLIAVGLIIFIGYWLALAVVTMIAIGKELYDKLSNTGTYDLWDALYTVIPIILIGLVLYVK